MFLLTNDAANWAAWGTWAYVGLTAALAFFAWLAYRATQRQLREAERARRDEMRPVVLFDRAALLPGTTDRKFVELTFVNHGPGPALEARFRVRLFPIPESLKANPTERQRFIAQCEAAVGATRPAGYVNIHGNGPGATEISYLMTDDQNTLIECKEENAVLFVTGQFDDVFGATFAYPSTKDADKVGFIFRLARLEDREPILRGT
jgi:hypothetical protein